jgi:hypothetical protein
MTQSCPVIQEHQITDFLENELKHVTQPDDVLLNLAHLHSATHVQKFQPPTRYPNLAHDTLIRTATRNCHLLEGSMVMDEFIASENPSQSQNLPVQTITTIHSVPVYSTHNQTTLFGNPISPLSVAVSTHTSRKRSRTNTTTGSSRNKHPHLEPAHA